MFSHLIGPGLLITVVVALLLLGDAWWSKRTTNAAIRDLERARDDDAHIDA
jgi:hypothetical protein